MSKAKKYYNLVDVVPKDYISKIGSHRFGLTFQTEQPLNGKSVAVIQMNGAKAGPIEGKNRWQSDSTIGKVLCWCYQNPDNQFEIVHCLNLFSIVDPHPKNLTNLGIEDLNTTENDEWIKQVCAKVDCIILAYGDCEGINPTVLSERRNQVLNWLEKYELYRVGEVTKNGNPRHGRSWNGNPFLTLHRKIVLISSL